MVADGTGISSSRRWDEGHKTGPRVNKMMGAEGGAITGRTPQGQGGEEEVRFRPQLQ